MGERLIQPSNCVSFVQNLRADKIVLVCKRYNGGSIEDILSDILGDRIDSELRRLEWGDGPEYDYHDRPREED